MMNENRFEGLKNDFPFRFDWFYHDYILFSVTLETLENPRKMT